MKAFNKIKRKLKSFKLGSNDFKSTQIVATDFYEMLPEDLLTSGRGTMFGHSCHSPSLKFYSKLDVGNVIIVILSRSMKFFLMSISW